MSILENTPPATGAPPIPSSARGLPADRTNETQRIANHFMALENFSRVFAIRPDDRVIILSDRLLDPRVLAAIDGHARARGVAPLVITSHTTQHSSIPGDIQPILAKATFVVSTWFCSVFDPFCLKLRREGQRWVKITYFREYDAFDTPHARFPVDIVSVILRATARRYGAGNGALTITDSRGSNFVFDSTPAMAEKTLSTSRWRGQLCADEPGAYVHYLPTHGPNVYERSVLTQDDATVMPINGTIYPQWAVGFAKPFAERIGVRFAQDRIVEVTGDSADAGILREMLLGARLIELGCGFCPKAPRYTIYPAGSNSPGAMHFGVDLAKPSDYIRRVMPNWEEPPVHMDLVTFDSTVTVGSIPLVTDGFLEALRDPEVVAAAAKYGDPIDLLEGWPSA